jgi:A/G-specific adenine glycosylase
VDLPAFTHVLTHKDLHLHPVERPTAADETPVAGAGQWVAADAWPALGLPAPVRKLLQQRLGAAGL